MPLSTQVSLYTSLSLQFPTMKLQPCHVTNKLTAKAFFVLRLLFCRHIPSTGTIIYNFMSPLGCLITFYVFNDYKDGKY